MELCLRPWSRRLCYPLNVILQVLAYFKLESPMIRLHDLGDRGLFFHISGVSGTAVSDGYTDLDVSVKAGELFDLYGNSILRLAYSYLHNQEDAEDILQNTLIRYIETAPQFFGKAHEKAWLMTVASNLSKNLIKHNKVRDADELLEELVAENKEDLAFVWEAAKKLPDNQREAVHLFYQEGYSTKEIAGILKRKESTVRSDLKRGRERMREILENEYGLRY